MTLTAEQMLAAATGQDVRFSINGVEYVVLRSDIFNAMVDAEHDELRTMLARSSVANGWDEPGMEGYDSYPAETP